VTIRWIGIESLAGIVAIVQDCRQALDLKAELAWSAEALQNSMETGRVLGAFEGERLVGFILFIDLSQNVCGHVEIWCLATHPNFHGQGVMGALLNELRTIAKEIWLEVHEHNSGALKFYKNKGFQEVGLRKRYYEDGGDAVLLSWTGEKH
jgi:ribosomal-protein-alanine N-acetyltransferase